MKVLHQIDFSGLTTKEQISLQQVQIEEADVF